MTFELRAAVAEALDTTSATHPQDIAAEVARDVPGRDLRAALALALEPFVREAIQHRRRDNPIIGPKPTGHGGSAKVRGIRDSWKAALRDLVHVEGNWKALGDCGYKDLMFAAEERREHARQNAAAAERYQRLADLVAEHKVSKVSDLPTEALEEFASEVAAA